MSIFTNNIKKSNLAGLSNDATLQALINKVNLLKHKVFFLQVPVTILYFQKIFELHTLMQKTFNVVNELKLSEKEQTKINDMHTIS